MKATFRLPDGLAAELRRRSEEEDRSINAVAIDALWRGLGGAYADDEAIRALGSFISQRATAIYQPEVVERKVASLSRAARELDEALDWTRGDR